MSALSGSGNRTPNYRREIDELKSEIRRLWQVLGRPPDEQNINGEIVYSWSGLVNPGAGRTSGPWITPSPLTLTRITMAVRTTTSGAITASVLVSGSAVESFSLPAGSPRATELIRVSTDANVPVQIVVTGASGANDLTVTLGYSR
jgi:hypothetical protein